MAIFKYIRQLFTDPHGNPSKTAFYAFVSVFGGLGLMLLVVIGVLYNSEGAIVLARINAFWVSCNTIILTGLGAYILHHRNHSNGNTNLTGANTNETTKQPGGLSEPGEAP